MMILAAIYLAFLAADSTNVILILEAARWAKKKGPVRNGVTLPETNIATENRPGPKRKRESIPTIHFQVP